VQKSRDIVIIFCHPAKDISVMVDAGKFAVIWRIRLLYGGRLAAGNIGRLAGAGIFYGILVLRGDFSMGWGEVRQVL
jgi:hypothetical protein